MVIPFSDYPEISNAVALSRNLIRGELPLYVSLHEIYMTVICYDAIVRGGSDKCIYASYKLNKNIFIRKRNATTKDRALETVRLVVLLSYQFHEIAVNRFS